MPKINSFAQPAEAITDPQRLKLISFGRWLTKRYHGNIVSVDMVNASSDFEIEYADILAQQEKQEAEDRANAEKEP